MITLPSGNALTCAEINSASIITPLIHCMWWWEMCVLGSFVDVVNVSG